MQGNRLQAKSRRWSSGCIQRRVDIGRGKGLWECGLRIVSCRDIGGNIYTAGMGALLMKE